VWVVADRLGLLLAIPEGVQSRQSPVKRLAIATLLVALGLGQSSARTSDATVTVLRCVDGDTVVVADADGVETTVRLIGVDTPEIHHPQKPVQRFAQEAWDFTNSLVSGREVRLEYEDGQPRRDRYGRTLAYIHRVEDSLFVNREIIAQGYGFAYTRYPFKHMEDFRTAEREAREEKRGLWKDEEQP
jgi:micrococcal nuclease